MQKKSSKDYTFDGEEKKQPLYNFQCKHKDCKHRFFEPTFVQKVDGTYLNKARSLLKCPVCGYTVEYVNNKKGYGSFMSFSAKSQEEKTKLLRQRAYKHAMSKKETEKREHIERNFTGKSINV